MRSFPERIVSRQTVLVGSGVGPPVGAGAVGSGVGPPVGDGVQSVACTLRSQMARVCMSPLYQLPGCRAVHSTSIHGVSSQGGAAFEVVVLIVKHVIIRQRPVADLAARLAFAVVAHKDRDRLPLETFLPFPCEDANAAYSTL